MGAGPPSERDRPFVLVSNRGPVSFARDDDGRLVAKRGAGGLVSGIGPLLAGTEAVWVAAAMSEEDREAAGEGVTEVEGFRYHALAVAADRYRAYYDEIANTTLWYLHHGLGDRARWPVADRAWWEAWRSFQAVNEDFAAAVDDVAPEGAVVLVQDLHLSLLAPHLRDRRPDLRPVHFSHTPFAEPDVLADLPEAPRRELLEGLSANRACGFHTARWRDAFLACCEADGVAPPATFVAPLGPDPDDILGVAASPAATDARAELDARVGERRLITRVDRIELSKNIVRGFLAYEELLATRPDWREQVTFAALVYPSRQGVPDYAAYRGEVEAVVERINQRFGTPGWAPVLYDDQDDFPRSVAALARADVVLVNPVRDGLNLVAKEAALVNDRGGVLVLSPGAGAWEELADVVVPCHPMDVSGTADALDRALSMGDDERRALSARWREAAAARTPADWLAANLEADGSG